MPLLTVYRSGVTSLLWLLSGLLVTPVIATTNDIVSLDNYFSESWSTVDGLPHNTVNAIAQTPDGYLWFATWEGVARFNGRRFDIFERSAVTGLPDSGIRTLSVAQNGDLLVAGSRGGIARVNGHQWQSYPPLGVLINKALVDSQQRLWLATEGEGVVMQTPNGSRRQFTEDNGLPANAANSVFEDSKGRIWVGTRAGLAVIDPDLVLRHPFPEQITSPVFALAANAQQQLLIGTERGLFLLNEQQQLTQLLADVPVATLLPEASGVLWIGTVDRGLLRLYNNTVEQLSIEQGLPNNRVLALLRDKERSLWVGTNGGIFRLRDAPFTTYTSEQGLADNYVRTVMSDQADCVYVGSSRGLDQICNGIIRNIDLSSHAKGQSVLSLAMGQQQSLWIGTYTDGLLHYADGKVIAHYSSEDGLAANEVRAILPRADGSVLVGTAQGLSLIRDGQITTPVEAVALPSPFIMALHQTDDGRVFIGSGAGVSVWQNDRVTQLDFSVLDQAEYAFGFVEDPAAGILWMTTDRGLVAFDLATEQLALIGRSHGMPFDKLFQLVIDEQQHFWISTNRGVLRLGREQALDVVYGRRDQINYELFGESDGMASAQANGGSSPAASLHNDGSVWVATSVGASKVQPARLSSFSAVIPPVVLEKLVADGKHYSLQQSVKLAAGTSRIELEYAGLGYIMPHRIQYRTMLEGFEQDWVARGTQANVQYTNLAPGHYTFNVAASYPDGGWSPVAATISFSIAPHLWQRPLFQALVILFLVALVIAIVRWRLASLKRSELKLKRQVAEKTAELAALARLDSLTGLANRRAFDEAMQHELKRAKRQQEPLCLALLDIDHFKQVNDNWSHSVGDEVLKRVAATLQQHCRDIDSLARWGGEEFVILLPDTSLPLAQEVCDRLRQRVADTCFTDIVPDLTVTLSIGLATLQVKDDGKQLLIDADRALYQAKNSGRNTVISHNSFTSDESL
ncbi:diguanylate cyclase (GGDEF) domain-containing protein [Arsukibacterium tuosuense]|uniref:diguanylate cyclase n=1 Tax=Arsukibacterium tuosuense TaxID=1323745 RepID=A0A285JCU3_9GAMM|nr:ligand-binding sensor domain-containing diguanylate cyclase [Arsukibacterium tuosuense]SNY57667.1 diguanylate cyclase (GGDEF) domain-containing protein [Arsukibacterium tuosuense]